MTTVAFFVKAERVANIFLLSQVYFREKANIKIFVLSLKAIKNGGRLSVRNEQKYKWGKAVGGKGKKMEGTYQRGTSGGHREKITEKGSEIEAGGRDLLRQVSWRDQLMAWAWAGGNLPPPPPHVRDKAASLSRLYKIKPHLLSPGAWKIYIEAQWE